MSPWGRVMIITALRIFIFTLLRVLEKFPGKKTAMNANLITVYFPKLYLVVTGN